MSSVRAENASVMLTLVHALVSKNLTLCSLASCEREREREREREIKRDSRLIFIW